MTLLDRFRGGWVDQSAVTLGNEFAEPRRLS